MQRLHVTRACVQADTHSTTATTTTTHAHACLRAIPVSSFLVVQVYLLQYRGVSFAFRIPAEFTATYAAASNDMPLMLPVGGAV
jgi:hypothetical protein